MTRVAKGMVAFGLVWILAWSIMGLYLDVGERAYTGTMTELAEQGNLEVFWKTFDIHNTITSAQLRALGGSLLIILVALAMPHIGLSSKLERATGLLLVGGAVLTSLFAYIGLAVLVAVGDVLVILGVLAGFLGAMRTAKQ